MFFCGVCEHGVKANRKAFRTDALDSKTWCNKCKKSHIAKAWNCKCKLPWCVFPKHGYREKAEVGPNRKMGED